MLATFNQFIQSNGIYYACVEEKYKVRKNYNSVSPSIAM